MEINDKDLMKLINCLGAEMFRRMEVGKSPETKRMYSALTVLIRVFYEGLEKELARNPKEFSETQDLMSQFLKKGNPNG